jgi:CIC family chloride channel protein
MEQMREKHPSQIRKAVSGALTSWTSYEHNTFLIVVAGGLGVICGLLSLAFEWMIGFVTQVTRVEPSAWFGSDSALYLLVVLPLTPALGGLIVGILKRAARMETESGSAAEVMKWAAVDRGIVRRRAIWVRMLASALTIGSGGSGGREGPIAQICGAAGSAAGQALKMSTERLRLLVGCGAAAGIAASFNAPIAGVIFTVELVLGDFNVVSFLPIVISSVMATTTKRLLLGDHPAFVAPGYAIVSYWEIGLYALLGVICGLVARLFFVAYFAAEDFFHKKVRAPAILKPALGGLMVGALIAVFPQAAGGGYDVMTNMLNGEMAWRLALTLVFVKIIATSITLGSGGSGGIFAPSLFLGCMTGGVFGTMVHHFFPDGSGPAGAYAMVGVASVMSAAAHAPLTNILMGYELTGNYQIILPIMTSCIMATFVMTLFSNRSIYTEKLARRGINLKRGYDVSVMDDIKVADVMRHRVTTIPENMPFGDIMKLISSSADNYFPVTDSLGRLSGVVSIQNLRETLLDSAELAQLVVAKEIATENVITLREDHNLNEAMEKFTQIDVEQLPVVRGDDPLRVVGMLSRMDVISAYNREVLQKAAVEG